MTKFLWVVETMEKGAADWAAGGISFSSRAEARKAAAVWRRIGYVARVVKFIREAA